MLKGGSPNRYLRDKGKHPKNRLRFVQENQLTHFSQEKVNIALTIKFSNMFSS